MTLTPYVRVMSAQISLDQIRGDQVRVRRRARGPELVTYGPRQNCRFEIDCIHGLKSDIANWQGPVERDRADKALQIRRKRPTLFCA